MADGTPFRYRSPDEDSGRWTGFPFRDGDIVISTRSKSGTTWMQMICALLVVQRPALPEPLWQMSPWLDWLLEWVDWDGDPRDELDSMPGVMMHLSDAWARRHEPNVVLVHYDDLTSDLDGEMRRLAARLGVEISHDVWPALVDAATFEAMKSRAAELAPDALGVLKSAEQFFRRGSSGAGRELLSDDEFDHYLARSAQLAPPDLLAWLHR